MKVSDKMKETIKRSRKFSSTMWLSEQTGLYYIGYGHIIPINRINDFILLHNWFGFKYKKTFQAFKI